MTFLNVIKLTKKRLQFSISAPNNHYMSAAEDQNLERFWKQFEKYRDATQINDDDWVTSYSAAKNSSLSRHIISRLAKDGLIRSQNDRFAFPDIRMIEQLLGYFEAAKKVEIIKETDITGKKKYLMLDFHQNNNFKSLPQYQIELVIKMYRDFFSKFYDLVPKDDTKLPDFLKDVENSK